jgi:hypothetical protein
VLLQADNGLFAARTENCGVSVERVGNVEMGRVSAKRDVPGGEGVLISAGKGWFLARVEQGAGATVSSYELYAIVAQRPDTSAQNLAMAEYSRPDSLACARLTARESFAYQPLPVRHTAKRATHRADELLSASETEPPAARR